MQLPVQSNGNIIVHVSCLLCFNNILTAKFKLVYTHTYDRTADRGQQALYKLRIRSLRQSMGNHWCRNEHSSQQRIAWSFNHARYMYTPSLRSYTRLCSETTCQATLLALVLYTRVLIIQTCIQSNRIAYS